MDGVAIDDITPEALLAALHLNFISAFQLCQLCLPHLRLTQGSIVNVSSWGVAHGQGRSVAYSAAKGALTAFTRALAVDEAPAKVRVNAVSPGWILTPRWKVQCHWQFIHANSW